MAVEIGALRALLSLDSTAFERGARRAEASMSRLQQRLTRFGRSMSNFGRTVSTRFTAPMVAGIGLAARSSLQLVDSQAKLAQTLDTSIVSVQNLARAADLAGISTGELEGSLTRMTRRLSLAEAGGGPAADALDRLGLSAADLNDIPVDERVQRVTEAIRELIPEAQQAGIASAIFGDRTGLAMMRLDPAVLQQAAREVARFGVAVSDVDADNIEAANDAVSALSLAARGLGNQLAVALAPTLQNIADAIADVAAWFAQLNPAVRRAIGVVAGLAAAVGPAAITIGVLAAALAAAATPIGLVIGGIAAIAAGAGLLVANWDGVANFFSQLWQRMQMGVSAVGAAATAMFFDLKADAASAVASAIQSVVDFGNSASNTFQGALSAISAIWSRLPAVIGDMVFSAANMMLDGVEAMLNGAIRRIDAFTGRIRDALNAVGIETTFGQIGEVDLGDIENRFAGASADAGAAAADAFQQAFEENPLEVPELGLDGIADDALRTANTYRQAAQDFAGAAVVPFDAPDNTEATADALDRATASANQLSDAMNDVADAAGGSSGGGSGAGGSLGRLESQLQQTDRATGQLDRGLDNISNRLADVGTAGFDLRDSLNQAFSDIARDLKSSGIRGILDGIISTLSGNKTGGAGGIVQFAQTAFATLTGARALGGQVQPYGVYEVGENGKEILQMGSRGGYITPNHALGGGGVSEVHIILNEPMLDAKIVNGSTQVATRIVRVQDRNVGARQASLQARGV